jgi:hypothetical protein
MTSPSPFAIGQAVGTNLGRATVAARDENFIDKTLRQVSQYNNPADVSNAMTQILSQVSPDRQPQALQFLQGKLAQFQAEKQAGQQRAGAKALGLPEGAEFASPQAQARFLQNKQQESESKDLRENRAIGSKALGLPPGAEFAPSQAQSRYLQNQQQQAQYNQVFGGGQSQEVALQPGQSPNIQGEQPQQDQGLSKYTTDQLKRVVALGGGLGQAAKEELTERANTAKADKADIRGLRSERAPLVNKIIEQADLSRESIRNKEKLIDLIDKGDINDPTFAIFAEGLPFNIGKRLLSEDTVVYKGGLVDEFSDLKNIFKGPARVKEIELYENKLADLYLTDGQKKAILKSRIDMSRVNLLREEAAAEVEKEKPNTTPLEFNKLVNEKTQPKLKSLYENVWGQQKSIIDDAERRRKLPIDINDPQDKQVVAQIMKEANGDWIKATKIAKEKGYTWKGK